MSFRILLKLISFVAYLIICSASFSENRAAANLTHRSASREENNSTHGASRSRGHKFVPPRLRNKSLATGTHCRTNASHARSFQSNANTSVIPISQANVPQSSKPQWQSNANALKFSILHSKLNANAPEFVPSTSSHFALTEKPQLLSRVSDVPPRLLTIIGHDASEIKEELPKNIFVSRKSKVKKYVVGASYEQISELAKEVREMIRESIVVGYKVRKLFKILRIEHPTLMIRDVECLKKFCDSVICKHLDRITLDDLELIFLGKSRDGEKDVESIAKTSLELYSRFRSEWETEIRNLIIRQEKGVAITSKVYGGFHCDDENHPLDALFVNKKTVAFSFRCENTSQMLTKVTIVDHRSNCVAELTNNERDYSEFLDKFKRKIDELISKGANVIVGYRIIIKLRYIYPELFAKVTVFDLADLMNGHHCLPYASNKFLHLNLGNDEFEDGVLRARLILQMYKLTQHRLKATLRRKINKELTKVKISS